MKTKTRNLLIATALAAAIGTTGVAVADMGGYGGGCQQGGMMQPGQGPGAMMNGMMGRMMGGMQSNMQGGMHGMGGMQERMQGGMSGMHGRMQGGMGAGLDLSDEQQAELGKFRQQFLPKIGELHGRMQASHEQLRAMMHGGTSDEAAIGKLADEHGDLMAEMIKLRAAQQARMQGLLTDEQREQMRQHRPGMGMGSGMDRGMMGTPPADG